MKGTVRYLDYRHDGSRWPQEVTGELSLLTFNFIPSIVVNKKMVIPDDRIISVDLEDPPDWLFDDCDSDYHKDSAVLHRKMQNEQHEVGLDEKEDDRMDIQ